MSSPVCTESHGTARWTGQEILLCVIVETPHLQGSQHNTALVCERLPADGCGECVTEFVELVYEEGDESLYRQIRSVDQSSASIDSPFNSTHLHPFKYGGFRFLFQSAPNFTQPHLVDKIHDLLDQDPFVIPLEMKGKCQQIYSFNKK